MKFVKMKYSKSLLLLMVVLSWLTFPLLGKDSIKRFLPAGIFISLVVAVEDVIARKRKWWWWYVKIDPKRIRDRTFFMGSVPYRLNVDIKANLW